MVSLGASDDPLGDILDRISGASATPSAGSGSSSAAAPREPNVFMGTRSEGNFRMDWRAPTYSGGATSAEEQAGRRPRAPGAWVGNRGVLEKPRKVKDLRPISQVQQDFFAWEDVERQKWAQHLVDVGFIDEDQRYDYQVLRDAWMSMVEEAANATGAGRDIDPWKMATIYAGGDESGATAAARGRAAVGEQGASEEEQGPVQRYTTSSRSRNVVLTDPKTAKALVNSVLAKALGRNANEDEMAQFRQVLEQAERDNPQTSKSTTRYVLNDKETGYNTRTTTTTKGGLSSAGAQQVLQDEAEQDPEYGAGQAAMTYWPVLEQALGSMGGN